MQIWTVKFAPQEYYVKKDDEAANRPLPLYYTLAMWSMHMNYVLIWQFIMFPINCIQWILSDEKRSRGGVNKVYWSDIFYIIHASLAWEIDEETESERRITHAFEVPNNRCLREWFKPDNIIHPTSSENFHPEDNEKFINYKTLSLKEVSFKQAEWMNVGLYNYNKTLIINNTSEVIKCTNNGSWRQFIFGFINNPDPKLELNGNALLKIRIDNLICILRSEIMLWVFTFRNIRYNNKSCKLWSRCISYLFKP